MVSISFQDLKKNLKKDFSGLLPVKLAVLGDSATQMYVQAIKGFGYETGIKFEVFEADYDQVERQIYDTSSELFKFKPEFVVIFFCSNKLMQKFGNLDLNEKPDFGNSIIREIKSLYRSLQSELKCKLIFANFPAINESVFGNYANKTNFSFTYQLRKINFELMNFAQLQANFYILDINTLQAQYGQFFITTQKIYINTDLFPSIDFLPILAKNTIDIVQSIKGNFKKCLILDLDNTLWGGIIGDDGMENIQIGDLGIGKAFSEIQLWVKQLKERGIIIAVCSKNDEQVAKEPFEKHSDMLLRLDDIAVFLANWENKADNIKKIQSILNIGFDSMVFLDDNPFERNMVRTHINDITVPELPEDPADYLDYLRTLNLFETSSFTGEDSHRTKQYQEEAKRSTFQQQFTNETEFLTSLKMVSKVEAFNSFNIPRVAQLTQRSNQFNLRTIRYSEEDIKRIANDSKYLDITFTLQDKFGDNGLISIVILQKKTDKSLFIDTWIMSCRVLKRNMENFVLNTIVAKAVEQGFLTITGEYIPTSKNNMVKDHYKNLGFIDEGGYWNLNVNNYIPKECQIEIE